MAHVDQFVPAHASGQHFACSMTSVLVRRVRAFGGEDAVAELLRIADCRHPSGFLEDTANWVSYDLAIALFDAAAQVTGDTQIGRRIGEDTVRQHAGTSVATLLRSLGSPEEVYRHMATAASKFSTVTEMETIELAPGRALVRAQAREGFKRARQHCDWTAGLLSTSTMLFGMPLATVEELQCQVDGASHCLYRISWDEALAARVADPAHHVTALESQLVAMTERLESMYATAADLIAGRDLDSTLARITERAATAVRAPRYLLAVRPSPDAELHCHHRGFGEGEALALATDMMDKPRDELPESWLVADVSSQLHRYGRIIAVHEDGGGFFPQELRLLQVYARYAATSLDVSTALADSERGHREARALLGLSRALADAGTGEEVAGKARRSRSRGRRL